MKAPWEIIEKYHIEIKPTKMDLLVFAFEHFYGAH